MKFALIFVFVVVLLNTFFIKCGASTEVMEIEERSSMWDQMNALTRLPADLLRRDYVAGLMDGIIVIEFLPLPFPIPMLLSMLYSVLKFIHPAYWWLFPATKPPNVKGFGFEKLWG
ncbi:hypothetical protein JTB14_024841 [Gonioctena quinquepunctata]|nr:hypothetical protein JTB14_024841 [Gonioctena quinquepunctata]